MNKTNVGGQAVIEGVMMRSPNYYAVSIRKKSRIITKTGKIKKKNPILKFFFIRGIVNLIEMLVLGMKTLVWSADQQTDEKEEKLSNAEVFWTLFISIAFAIIIFVALPYFLTHLMGFVEETRPVLFNLLDAIIKIAIFLIYLFSISLIKDVKRIFEYHGAEHKAVFCYEEGKALTVKNTRKFSTLHPRCGTSFIFIVFIFSILLFSLLPIFVLKINPNFNELRFALRRAVLFPLRIAFIPVIAGVSYELLKLTAKFKNNSLLKLIALPGIAIQKITTKKPNKKQIEVAIAALNKVLRLEKRQ